MILIWSVDCTQPTFFAYTGHTVSSLSRFTVSPGPKKALFLKSFPKKARQTAPSQSLKSAPIQNH